MIRNGSVDYYNEFIPFMEASQMWFGTPQLVVRGLTGLEWIVLVEDKDRANFTARVQSFGTDFANFTIKDVSSNGTLIPARKHAEYYVILNVAPRSMNSALGLNVMSSAFQSDEVIRARYTGKNTGTRAFSLVNQKKGFLYFSPVNNTEKTFVGLTASVFTVDHLFHDFYDDKVFLIVFDQNVTDADRFIYSTYNTSDIDDYGDPSKLSGYGYLTTISKAPYYEISDLLIADRQWLIVYVPKAKFLQENNGWPKYFGIAGSFLCSLFVVFILLAIVKWLQYRNKLYQMNLARIVM